MTAHLPAPTVAIIGRPNVGKSTLFNRLIGRREAIVDDQPGVTRDRHFAAAEWNGRRFWLVDTGGMVLRPTDALDRAIRTQVELAIAESDVVLFLVAVDDGVHPADLEIARYLRKASRPIVLVANKADQLPEDTRHLAFYELGLGDPVPVSAAVGKSTGDLLDRVVDLLPAAGTASAEAVIRVAVVGRPNVGKSSLVNRLLGTERLVVAEEPGTTRDAIDTPLAYRGHRRPAQAGQGAGRHRILFDAPDRPGHRAIRRLRAGGRRDRRHARAGPEDRR